MVSPNRFVFLLALTLRDLFFTSLLHILVHINSMLTQKDLSQHFFLCVWTSYKFDQT